MATIKVLVVAGGGGAGGVGGNGGASGDTLRATWRIQVS
jgi:hypothetical protein